ncbi:transposase [Haemophilus haemoglobinophilus]|nr:transposase [Canicola haemoglobinophilus]
MSNYRRYFVQGGAYFVTVVLKDRTQNYLTDYIALFRQAYQKTIERYPFETIAICILPDHFHLIMQLPENDDNFSIRIAYLKTLFSRGLPKHCKQANKSQFKRRELGIWQRRFWDHVIRDERDLYNHMDYVYYNPVKHQYVNSVKDWEFSSFHRDVEKGIYPLDWGGEVSEQCQNLYQEL